MLNCTAQHACRSPFNYCAIDGSCPTERQCYPERFMDKPTARQLNPLTAPRARTFKLGRDEDETGISGTGIVAEGIEFSNGMCAMCWLTAMHSVAVYPNVRQLEAIHGHNGRARIVFDPA
jgi:hypothetical protein